MFAGASAWAGREIEAEPVHARRGPRPEPAPPGAEQGEGERRGEPDLHPCARPARGARRRRSGRRRRDAGRPRAPALERVGELRRAGEPVRRQLLQRDEDGGFDLGRDGVPLGQDGPRRLGQDPGHDRLRGGAGERRVAGEHLVQHHAQRVDVGAGGDLPLAHRLLGRHVVRRAQRHAGLGHPVRRRPCSPPARCRSRPPAPGRRGAGCSRA